ncbi:MAG TPA: hypothetical protein VHZ54_20200, partial [Solirubrobacterales bacterium]|nr:hypothetical protein [Solirubrobacterales bacterium]
ELKVGPMKEGAAANLRDSLSLPDIGGSLETLADEVRTETDADGEYLVVAIAGHFGSSPPRPGIDVKAPTGVSPCMRTMREEGVRRRAESRQRRPAANPA